MKKLMTAALGLSMLTGLAAVSFARPDDSKMEDTSKTKAKKAKKGKKTKKDDTAKTEEKK